MKWKNQLSSTFKVTKGTRQGSILSPQLFNIFIDDLLRSLSDMPYKVCIGSAGFNSFAYADDVTLICTTSHGLQRLIDRCHEYASNWRFKFGIKKTKCMCLVSHRLQKTPQFYLQGNEIENVNELELLGTIFSQVDSNVHVEKRADKCRRAFYSLRDSGMAYPGCASDVKAYLWKTVCHPVLMYSMECIPLSMKNKKSLYSTQGNLLKKSLGLHKSAKTSGILGAMNVPSTDLTLKKQLASLGHRICCVESPARDVHLHFLSLFMCNGTLIPGTLCERLINHNISPMQCFVNKRVNVQYFSQNSSGVVDSLRILLMHENFIKPYSDEHVLATLLTKSF